MGVVPGILESKDGRVRSVKVRYKNNKIEVLVRRAVQRLIVIVPAEDNKVQEKLQKDC